LLYPTTFDLLLPVEHCKYRYCNHEGWNAWKYVSCRDICSVMQ